MNSSAPPVAFVVSVKDRLIDHFTSEALVQELAAQMSLMLEFT